MLRLLVKSQNIAFAAMAVPKSHFSTATATPTEEVTEEPKEKPISNAVLN